MWVWKAYILPPFATHTLLIMIREYHITALFQISLVCSDTILIFKNLYGMCSILCIGMQTIYPPLQWGGYHNTHIRKYMNINFTHLSGYHWYLPTSFGGYGYTHLIVEVGIYLNPNIIGSIFMHMSDPHDRYLKGQNESSMMP